MEDAVIYRDYEIIATNYDHPDIKSGQHTNGPAIVWVRYKDGPWINTGEKSLHTVWLAINVVSLIRKAENEST